MSQLDTLQVLLGCDRARRQVIQRPALDALIKARDRRVWRVTGTEIATNVIGSAEWTQVRPLRMFSHITALLMANKKDIFIFDGRNGIIYDTQNDDWNAIPDPPTHRVDFAAVSLADGSVFVCGGASNDVEGDAPSTADIFYRGGWYTVDARMNRPREDHACTALKDGRVLITGGFALGVVPRLMTTEIYDPRTRRFMMVDATWSSLWQHATIALPTGDVLICGGITPGRIGTTKESFIYSVERNEFTRKADMNIARSLHQLVSYENGRVIVAIGGRVAGERTLVAEMYDFTNDRWVLAPDYDLQDEEEEDVWKRTNFIFADAD